MSLRSRVLIGWALVLVLLVIAGAAIVVTQRSFAMGQVDDQLLALEQPASRAVHRAPGGGTPTIENSRLAASLYGLWVGWESPRGDIVTVSEPVDGLGGEPQLQPGVSYETPTTVHVVGEPQRAMRVVSFNPRPKETLLLAAPLDDVSNAINRLVRTLAASLLVVAVAGAAIMWWTLRLGVTPIRRVTDAARRVRAGETSVRVESFPAGTEAQELGVAFNTLVEQNLASEQRLRQFVADASHELRTPITTLSGYASLYAAGGLQGEALDDAMSRMKQEAARMQRLVDDLMLLAQLDQGSVLERHEVDLVPLVAGLVSDLRVVASDREVTVESPDTVRLVCDPQRVTQVIAVLTDNAVRHTPAGSPIVVSVATHDDVVRVAVLDQGPGIPEAERELVFNRFHRVSAGRDRSTGGSGLGLSIAAAIVSAHGGRMGVDDGRQGGSSFWFELPLAGYSSSRDLSNDDRLSDPSSSV